jgi:diguanylate cyclase (GGDEF)-like protein
MNTIDLDSENRFEPQRKEGSIKKVLMIEDNIDDANIIQEMLTDAIESSFELINADCLESGLKELLAGGIDIVLLDLSLPDSQVQDTFGKLYERTSDVPIIILASPGEESLAVRATQLGAQDYVIKGKTDSLQLRHLIKYAVEQHEMQHELSNLTLVDKLTGLYTRQSLFILSQHYLKHANRVKKGMMYFLIEISNFNEISNTFNFKEQENALIDTANILKQTFRRSDVIARYAESIFAVVALEASNDSDRILTKRLQTNLSKYKQSPNRSFKLSLQVGTAYYNPKYPCSIIEIIARACKALYTGSNLE